MTNRSAALAFVLSASMLVGCTIEYSSGGAEAPPPPPPPPPGQTAQPAQPGTPAPAATPAKKTRIRSLRTVLGGGAADPQQDPAATEGTLKVQVVDGSCDIKIDGVSVGTSNAAEKKVSVGTHEVSCTPAASKEQKHSAEIKLNETTTVAFSIQAGTGATVPTQ